MRDVYIGLGSNVGDRLSTMSAALTAIDALEGTSVVSVSGAVESEPWGVADQPRFANAVARVSTSLEANRLLDALKDVEAALGRTPGPRNGPRLIDLDILLVGDEEWDSPELIVPHPRMAERDFVITPLLELAPHVCWPDGAPITRERVSVGRVVGALGPVPGFESVTPPLGGWVTGGHAEAGSWEEVSSALFGMRRGFSFAAGLLFDAAVLEQEGIPLAWDPMPPNEEYSPWSLPRTYRLLVPVYHAEHARHILVEARAGEIVPEESSLSADMPEPEGDRDGEAE